MKEKFRTFIKEVGEFLKQEKVRKGASWTAVGILLLIVLFVAIPLIPNSPYSLRMVTSNSMSPTFNTGSLVVITPENSYEKDEIITYQKGQYERNIVTHRIVEKKDEGLITKGDANAVADDTPVPPENVHGKVIFSIPRAGYVIDFVQRPFGFALVIIIPVLIIISDEIKNIFKEVKKHKKQ